MVNRIDTEILQAWQRECRDFVLIDTPSGQRLERLGFTQVLHYEGGKNDWVASGLPLVRGD